MKRQAGILFTGVLMMILATGCSSKQQVVLLPDPDGKVGSIEVSTQAGTRVIDRAGYAVEVSSASSVPSEPKKLDEEALGARFAGALSVEPMPPARFILYFEKGTSDLTDESEARLADVFTAIEDRASTDISIIGHTDTLGSAKDNQALSLDRARALGGILKEKGVDMSVVEITSHGETNQLVPTPDETEEPRNRRVEIIVR